MLQPLSSRDGDAAFGPAFSGGRLLLTVFPDALNPVWYILGKLAFCELTLPILWKSVRLRAGLMFCG
jgi:hypothetical protein